MGPDTIDFYWFSGTGNTLLAVKAMQKVFTNAGKNVNLYRIEKTDPSAINLDSVIGIGVTVAEQGTFPFVWDFINSLPETEGSPVFLVDTMMMYSGGIIGPVGKILKKKGYRLLGAKEIVMPNNLLKIKNQPDKDSKIVKKGEKTAAGFAEKLLNGKTSWIDIPFYSSLMGSISKSNSTWNFMRKKIPLKINESICNSCKLCVKLCPVSNIIYSEKKRKIIWNYECQYCLRCFSYCPTLAISYGKKDYLRHQGVNSAELLKDNSNSPLSNSDT